MVRGESFREFQEVFILLNTGLCPGARRESQGVTIIQVLGGGFCHRL